MTLKSRSRDGDLDSPLAARLFLTTSACRAFISLVALCGSGEAATRMASLADCWLIHPNGDLRRVLGVERAHKIERSRLDSGRHLAT